MINLTVTVIRWNFNHEQFFNTITNGMNMRFSNYKRMNTNVENKKITGSNFICWMINPPDLLERFHDHNSKNNTLQNLQTRNQTTTEQRAKKKYCGGLRLRNLSVNNVDIENENCRRAMAMITIICFLKITILNKHPMRKDVVETNHTSKCAITNCATDQPNMLKSKMIL